MDVNSFRTDSVLKGNHLKSKMHYTSFSFADSLQHCRSLPLHFSPCKFTLPSENEARLLSLPCASSIEIQIVLFDTHLHSCCPVSQVLSLAAVMVHIIFLALVKLLAELRGKRHKNLWLHTKRKWLPISSAWFETFERICTLAAQTWINTKCLVLIWRKYL